MNQHQDFSVFDGYKEPNRDSESQDDYGMVDWDADWESECHTRFVPDWDKRGFLLVWDPP